MTVSGFEEEVLNLMKEKDIPCETYIKDVEELVAEDKERFRANRVGGAGAGDFNLTIYHDYLEVDKDKIVWFYPPKINLNQTIFMVIYRLWYTWRTSPFSMIFLKRRLSDNPGKEEI